jgi:hypothetical protein
MLYTIILAIIVLIKIWLNKKNKFKLKLIDE